MENQFTSLKQAEEAKKASLVKEQTINLFSVETTKRFLCFAILEEDLTKEQKAYIEYNYGEILAIWDGSVGDNLTVKFLTTNPQ